LKLKEHVDETIRLFAMLPEEMSLQVWSVADA
jgi:hypothetical protein